MDRKICRELTYYVIERDGHDTVFSLELGSVKVIMRFERNGDVVEMAHRRQRCAAWAVAIAKLADEEDFEQPSMVKGIHFCTLHSLRNLLAISRGDLGNDPNHVERPKAVTSKAGVFTGMGPIGEIVGTGDEAA